MFSAFQSNAFQNNAFQIMGAVSSFNGDTHDNIRRHRERLKRHARAAESAIYRNVDPPKIAREMREAMGISEPLVHANQLPEIKAELLAVPYDLARLPFARHDLEMTEDEEEFMWLLTH